MFLAAPHVFLLFLLGYVVPEKKLEIDRRLKAGIVVTIILMILSLTPAVISEIRPINGRVEGIPGFGMYIFMVFSSFLVFNTFKILIKKYKSAKRGIKKKQLLMISWAILFLVSALLLTFTIPVTIFNVSFFVRLAPLYTLIFLTLTAVAIIKYRLFRIKLIFSRLMFLVAWTTLAMRVIVSHTQYEFVWHLLIFTIVFSSGALFLKVLEEDQREHEAFKRRLKKIAERKRKVPPPVIPEWYHEFQDFPKSPAPPPSPPPPVTA